jgi:hypothetical protein
MIRWTPEDTKCLDLFLKLLVATIVPAMLLRELVQWWVS